MFSANQIFQFTKKIKKKELTTCYMEIHGHHMRPLTRLAASCGAGNNFVFDK